MRKSDALWLGLCILVIIALVLFWAWAMTRGRDDRKEAFEAQCKRDGGKIVTSYTANYTVERVACVPVGVNPADVLRGEK